METIVEQPGIMNCSIGWGSNSTGSGLRIELSDHYQFADYPYFQQYWYPNYTISYLTEDKTKQAFRIVKVLMKKKVVKLDKVKDFVTLVDEILEIL